MTGTAFHTEDRVDIRIDHVLEENFRFAGVIVRIHTDDETSGDLMAGDEVTISIDKICHIDQDKT
jgi:predicted RNA-binding protein with TRAM domain